MNSQPVVQMRHATSHIPSGLPPNLDADSRPRASGRVTRRTAPSLGKGPSGALQSPPPSPPGEAAAPLDKKMDAIEERLSRKFELTNTTLAMKVAENAKAQKSAARARLMRAGAKVIAGTGAGVQKSEAEVKEDERQLKLKGRGVVKVHLHCGHNLRAMDDTNKDGKKDTSDPYCTLSMHDTKHRGKTIQKTINPRWEQDFEFRGETEGDIAGEATLTLRELLEAPLELNVMDEDRFMGRDDLAKNEHLGMAVLDLCDLMTTSDFKQEMRTRVELDTQGSVELTIKWELEHAFNPLARELKGRGVVRVHVHGGRGIKPGDDTTGDGKKDSSDPYLRLFLGEKSFRTETKLKTLNPRWDELYEFDGLDVIYASARQTIGDLLCTNLELECYDEDKAMGFGMLASDPLLGTATVNLKPFMYIKEGQLKVPLSTQGHVNLTVSWEVEEEYISEVENDESDEDVIGEIFGRKKQPEGGGETSPAEAAKVPSAKAAPAAPAGPDMLSLSIAISILVKFILFDLVGFFQVNSSLTSSMPELEFPPEFSEMSRSISSAFNLDFVTETGESNCSLGSNHCFRIMVMMLTLLGFQLAFPAGYALAKLLENQGKISRKRLETLVDRSIHGNAIVMMALHPPIAKKLVGLVECSMYNDVPVLANFKDIECGSGSCTAVAAVFICLYTLGVPLYVYLSLRAYLSPAAKQRYQGNPILARYRARIGFICGKYEANFWYYELYEMCRKTGLMAVTSFIQKGSYSQLFAKILISGFFFVVLVRCTPFNSERLDLLVSTGQFCSLATLFMMLMMKIGFFVEEGIPVDVMNSVLMFIMFFPLFVAVYIISAAIHEAFAAHFKKVVWPKWKAAVKTILGKAWKVFDAQTKYAY
jgi:hypothetical protein